MHSIDQDQPISNKWCKFNDLDLMLNITISYLIKIKLG